MYEPASQATKIDWSAQVLDPLKQIFIDIIKFIPLLVKAAGIILIGWAIAWVVMKLLWKFLETIHFDRIAETTGIDQVLDEQKLGMSPAQWISKLFYWFGIFISWIIALDVLRLQLPSVMLEEIGGFLSTIFIGVIIFLLGLFLSMVASKFVESTARKLGAGNPILQAAVIRWAVILLTFVTALSHFGFPSDFILIVLAAVGLTLCITFVIAVGIGGIPCVPMIYEKMHKK